MCHVLSVLKLTHERVCARVCVQALCSDMTQVSITDPFYSGKLVAGKCIFKKFAH